MPSTLIRHFHYDVERQILTVEFVAGPVYQYLQVPPAIYEQMKTSFAKGVFFNRYIRDKFSFHKLITDTDEK